MRNLYLLSIIFTLYAKPCFSQYFGGNGDGFSVASIGSPGTEIALPIELVYFNANLNDKKILITWITVTQSNNSHFTLERSADGVNFITIGTVKGAGHSNERLTYTFTDNEPLNSHNYYRLKQTDFDGKYVYSQIIAAFRDLNETILQVYPNPNMGNFVVITTDASTDLLITNASGEKIITQKLASAITNIDMSNSPSGIYYLYVISNNKSQEKKIFIIK